MKLQRVSVETARLPQVGIVRTTIGSPRPSLTHTHILYGIPEARLQNERDTWKLFDMKTGGLSKATLAHPFIASHGLRFNPTSARDEARTKALKVLADTIEQLGFPDSKLNDILAGNNGEKILYARGNLDSHHHIIVTNHAGVNAAEALAQLIRKTQTANHLGKSTIQLVTHNDL